MKKLLCLMLMFGVLSAEIKILTSTNDPTGNELMVYDLAGNLVQTVSTGGLGGVPENGGGVITNGALVAVVNYSSQDVTLFSFHQGVFNQQQIISTQSNPISVAFGNDHLYVLGATTIESFPVEKGAVGRNDGVANLLIGDGSAAQVGVLNDQLIISEKSNAIELVNLINGAVSGNPSAVALPAGSSTPLGLVTRKNYAYITLAHSNQLGLVTNGKLVSTTSSDTQQAPCWAALNEEFLFVTNPGSNSISRYRLEKKSIVADQLVAASTVTSPKDIAIRGSKLAVLENGNNVSHLTIYQINPDKSLRLLNSLLTVPTANGIALHK